MAVMLTGDASNWRETKIAGKKFRLNHVRVGNNLADMAAIRALNNVNMTAAMIAAPDGTPAPALPAGATGNTVIPAHNVHVDEDWSIAGGCAVDAGTATNAPNGATNNNNPIVLPDINISQEIYLFKTQYTTILRQQQEMIFGTLVQGSNSIREYYRKICRYTKLGGVNDAYKRAQFLRGLSHENKLEIKRLGLNKPLNNDLIESLEAIETEKNEMLLSDISTPVQAKAPSITTADIERIVSARVADALQKSQPSYIPPVSHPAPVIDPRYKEAFDRLVILALALGYPVQDDVKWENNVTVDELERFITDELLSRLPRNDPAHDNMYIRKVPLGAYSNPYLRSSYVNHMVGSSAGGAYSRASGPYRASSNKVEKHTNKTRKCSNCGKSGHTKNGCSKKSNKAKKKKSNYTKYDTSESETSDSE